MKEMLDIYKDQIGKKIAEPDGVKMREIPVTVWEESFDIYFHHTDKSDTENYRAFIEGWNIYLYDKVNESWHFLDTCYPINFDDLEPIEVDHESHLYMDNEDSFATFLNSEEYVLTVDDADQDIPNPHDCIYLHDYDEELSYKVTNKNFIREVFSRHAEKILDDEAYFYYEEDKPIPVDNF
jgi:hypothetical protein